MSQWYNRKSCGHALFSKGKSMIDVFASLTVLGMFMESNISSYVVNFWGRVSIPTVSPPSRKSRGKMPLNIFSQDSYSALEHTLLREHQCWSHEPRPCHVRCQIMGAFLGREAIKDPTSPQTTSECLKVDPVMNGMFNVHTWGLAHVYRTLFLQAAAQDQIMF